MFNLEVELILSTVITRPRLKEIIMLVLSRKVDERILIGDDIVLTITKVGKKVVKVGIEAPDDIKILREELIKDKVKSLIDKNKK